MERLTPPRRRSVIRKPRPLRRPVFEAAAAGRSIISEAAPASITKSAPSGTLITKAAAARVTEAAAARVAVTESAAPGAVIATEAASRRRPVVGPGAAAAPVRRPVGGGAPLAFGGLRSLSLGRALGAQALGFRAVSRDLCGAALLVLAACVEINR